MGFEVETCDFMETVPISTFDAVIMNPPFEKQLDITHVLHAFRFLKPGGTLAAIMSASILWRSNKKTVQFREFLDSIGADVAENAADAFKESGTLVRTITISLTKPMDAKIEAGPMETRQIKAPAVEAAQISPPVVNAPAVEVMEAKAPVTTAAPEAEKVEQFGFDF
jgi:ubiquinone/menaquinone biosynthesis C-methylase UbiE